MSLRRELEEIEKIKSMSIENEIDRINTAKQDIKSAIEDKGVSVPDDARIDEYSQYIGGLVNPSDVVTSLNGEKGDVKLRPTYYKLNGTPVTDDGGVGTKYTIAISNLTPSSPAPQAGDTVVFYTDSYTYIGTVTGTQTDAVVADVKVSMLSKENGQNFTTGQLAAINSGINFEKVSQIDSNSTAIIGLSGAITSKYTKPSDGIPMTDLSQEVQDAIGGGSEIQYYDTVIGSQEDFEAWYAQLDAGTYEGHSVLFLNGTYTRNDGKGLYLPETLYTIKGVGNVTIRIDDFNDRNNAFGLGYYRLHLESYYSIKNIILNLQSHSSSIGISGFSLCNNVENCLFSGTGMGHTSGFYSCNNLTDCVAYANTNGGYGRVYGFDTCTNLVNCYSEATGSSYNDGYGGAGFNACENLVNCEGLGQGYFGYAFLGCKQCSNCRNDKNTQSSGYTFDGTCTNVDPDTCPEYEGGGSKAVLSAYSITLWMNEYGTNLSISFTMFMNNDFDYYINTFNELESFLQMALINTEFMEAAASGFIIMDGMKRIVNSIGFNGGELVVRCVGEEDGGIYEIYLQNDIPNFQDQVVISVGRSQRLVF